MKKQVTVKRAKKGQGTLVQGTSGVWMLRQVVNGKVITKSLQTHNKREAEKKRKQLVKENLPTGEEGQDDYEKYLFHLKWAYFYLARSQASKIELDNIFETYKSNPTISIKEGTLNVYHSHINSLVAFIKTHYPKVKAMTEITEDMVKEWLQDEATKGKAGNTLSLHSKSIKRVFRVLMGKHNPIKDMTFGGKVKIRYQRNPFTEEETRAILKTAREESTDMKLFFYLGYYTGIRKGDCACMRWRNVDMEKRTITVLPQKTEKTGKLVVVPICDELYEVLQSIKPATINPDDYLSPLNAKTYLNNHLSNKITRILIRAGVKKKGDNRRVSFHCFRHTFCSDCANNGVNQLQLQAMMGHTTLGMTSRYYHPDVESVRDKLECLSLNK